MLLASVLTVTLPCKRRNCLRFVVVSHWQLQFRPSAKCSPLKSLVFLWVLFCVFIHIFLIYFLFYFGVSSRSRAVKYSWLCCVLKIRLISTPSLFSSSASPLSLRSDEQQKHVYLARFVFFPRRDAASRRQDLALLNSVGTLGGPAGVWWLLSRGHLHESRGFNETTHF